MNDSARTQTRMFFSLYGVIDKIFLLKKKKQYLLLISFDTRELSQAYLSDAEGFKWHFTIERKGSWV